MQTERRELFECSDCGATIAVVYDAEPQEHAEVAAAVACPECGWASFVSVVPSAAVPLQPRYRVETIAAGPDATQ